MLQECPTRSTEDSELKFSIKEVGVCSRRSVDVKLSVPFGLGARAVFYSALECLDSYKLKLFSGADEEQNRSRKLYLHMVVI